MKKGAGGGVCLGGTYEGAYELTSLSFENISQTWREGGAQKNPADGVIERGAVELKRNITLYMIRAHYTEPRFAIKEGPGRKRLL